jgi:hypothetical protein
MATRKENIAMTDTQLYLVIGIPLLFNSLGFILTNKRIDDLRDTIRDIRADVHALTSKVVEIDNRLTRIEERMGIGR